jgi:hypothetical protein
MGGGFSQKFPDVVVRPKIFFGKRGVFKLIFKIDAEHKI